jgi:hypothetical protein
MYSAFTLGYYYMINGQERWGPEWEDNLMNSFLMQFSVLFGSFDSFDLSYRIDSNIEIILFMFTAMIMPLLMLNLLIAILGNAYIRVKDEWRMKKFYEKIVVIYDLELLVFWNR